jgi:aminoglycoside 6'-N-acetyltransferase
VTAPGHRLRLSDARIVDGQDREAALVALRREDLPLVGNWLRAPHVQRWWPDPDAGLAEIASCIDGEEATPFLIVAGMQPIGYLQIYHANPEPFWAAHDLPRETFGIDLFIGVAEAVGKGWGPRVLRLALRRLFAVPEIVRVHVDPDPANAAAVCAYEKAGFRKAGLIETPDGPALYMVVER